MKTWGYWHTTDKRRGQIEPFKRKTWNPIVAQQVKNLPSIHERVGSIPGSALKSKKGKKETCCSLPTSTWSPLVPPKPHAKP